MDDDDVNTITPAKDDPQDGLDMDGIVVADKITSGEEDISAAPVDIDEAGAAAGRPLGPTDPLGKSGTTDIFEDDQESGGGGELG